MIYAIMYGLTIGAVLYLISIGLSLTFGTMRVINFAHTITYTIAVSYTHLDVYKRQDRALLQ